MSALGAGPGEGAHAQVVARVDVRASSAQSAAMVAAELMGRLQEIANRSDCECDVDVSVAWPAEAAPRR